MLAERASAQREAVGFVLYLSVSAPRELSPRLASNRTSYSAHDQPMPYAKPRCGAGNSAFTTGVFDRSAAGVVGRPEKTSAGTAPLKIHALEATDGVPKSTLILANRDGRTGARARKGLMAFASGMVTSSWVSSVCPRSSVLGSSRVTPQEFGWE